MSTPHWGESGLNQMQTYLNFSHGQELDTGCNHDHMMFSNLRALDAAYCFYSGACPLLSRPNSRRASTPPGPASNSKPIHL